MRAPYSRCLIEKGEQYIQLDLRPEGIKDVQVLAGQEFDFRSGVRVLTIYGISVGGVVSIRVDLCHDEDKFHRVLNKQFPDVGGGINTVPLDLALKLIEDRLWYHIEDFIEYQDNAQKLGAVRADR